MASDILETMVHQIRALNVDDSLIYRARFVERDSNTIQFVYGRSSTSGWTYKFFV
jgi:hypothetical protein